ncbi:MAG: N-acetylmuramoyl-L-alanine amidase [Ruminococcaceae bacterium]|nr:N-acetylmuramoyl-L-alanine amidase [Oscillospiraceae bacterium]
MFKIALNAGHGLYTAGKRCLKSIDPNETREWSLNSRICRKIEEKLARYTGYELIRLDDISGETDVALKKRTDKANEFGAQFYLSIHHNAGIKGGEGGGVIAIVYPRVDNTTLEWQKELYTAVIEQTGLKGNRSVPLSKQDLHELRESNMPAVILECGFMDSRIDTPIILTENFADSVAEACVSVLVKRGGLTLKKSGNEATTPKNDVIYQVWEDVGNRWLPNVKNLEDYAGIFGRDVCCVFANLTRGNIIYKVHTKGGRWLPEVRNREDYAGIFNRPIDAVMMKTDTGEKLSYAVHLRRQKRWLPFVDGYSELNSNNGYAGIIGQEIDAIKIYFKE